MTVITVGNMKGGVGKTTLSLLFARYLANRGYTVFLVDADPQGTLSAAVLSDRIDLFDERGRLTLGMHVVLREFLENRSLSNEILMNNVVFVESPTEPFWLLPNCVVSSHYDYKLKEMGKQLVVFRHILRLIDIDPDVVIFDTPPYFNSFLVASLVCSDCLLIPAETSIQALSGVYEMLDLVLDYQRDGIMDLRNIRILPSKHKRTRIAELVLDRLVENFGDYLLEGGKVYFPFTELCNRVFCGEISLEQVKQEAEKSKKDNSMASRLLKFLKLLETEVVLPYASEETLAKLVKE